MIFGFLLSVRTGDFFMDIIFPAVAGGAVLLMIGASILKKWGYSLW